MKGESKKSSVLDFFAVLFPLSAKKAGGNEFPGKELNSFQTKTLRLSFVCRYFAKIFKRYCAMTQKAKTYMLPAAMISGSVAGYLFPQATAHWATLLAPCLIFAMLLVTYCKISLNELNIRPLHWGLLAIQIVGGLIVFGALYFWNPIIAEGTFICLFCPTATAAPVITGMLGGNVSTLVSYSLVSNMAVAILSPIIFSFMGVHADISFVDSVLIICSKVLPLLILPLVTALVLQKAFPCIHEALKKRQPLSFYMWAVSLFLVVGKAVTFIIDQGWESVPFEIAIALLSLAACIAQFYLGRKIGGRYGDKISGAQGLGQKNTVLAIWMALTYLSPITSIGPASYIIWQNSINSYQLYRKEKRDSMSVTAQPSRHPQALIE